MDHGDTSIHYTETLVYGHVNFVPDEEYDGRIIF